MPTHLLLITGPAGIGKSTLCWEMAGLLSEGGVAHAVIESDELDRAHPRPTAAELEALRPGTRDVSTLNLAALWSTYRRLGHTRLIMSGVMLHLSFDRGWILAAIPDAELTVVRLQAAEETLIARLRRREIGSGAEEQIARSLKQSRRMAAEATAGVVPVATDGEPPQELALHILRAVGWLDAPPCS